MRYIDADAISEDQRQQYGFFYDFDLQELLDAQPTIDAVEVVNSCSTCLRQGCAYRDGTIRVNCPLWKGSAV